MEIFLRDLLAAPVPHLAARIDEVLRQGERVTTVTYLDRRARLAEALSPACLRERALARASILEAAVPAGGTCLLVMPAGPEFLTTLLGCLYAGIVAVPLPEPHLETNGERLDAVLADSGAAAILCTAANLLLLQQHFATPEGRSPPCALLTMDAMETNAGPGREPVCAGLQGSPDDTVIVQYTSGSTRHPRGVALSSRNIQVNAAIVFDEWQLQQDADVTINWLPHYHDMGLLGGLLYPLLGGGSSVQMPPVTFIQHPLRWLQTVSEYRGTVSGGPAFALSLCLDTISNEHLRGLDLSCWKTLFCGAEPVSADLLQRFRTKFAGAGLEPAAVFGSYGLAEATLFVAGRRADLGGAAAGTADVVHGETPRLEPSHLSPVTRALLQIVDPATCLPLSDGAVGEVWVTGASVSRGYVQQAGSGPTGGELFHAHLRGSDETYLRTGDLGWIGSAGLYISGRMKDMLIANGANVAAVDVEWLAAACHPGLNPLAAAAVALALEEGTETSALLIEVKTPAVRLEDPAVLAETIRRAVRATFGIELRLVQFVTRGALERTTSGKVRRRRVAARLREGHQYPEVLT